MTPTCITGTGIVSCFGVGTDVIASALSKSNPKDRLNEKRLSAFNLQDSEHYLVNEINRSGMGQGYAGEIQLFIKVIKQALEQANIKTPLTDCGLIIGTSGFMFAAESEFRLHERSGNETADAGYDGLIINPVVNYFGIGGPVFSVHTACASSANAMILAHEMISRDEAKRVIVVGAEGLGAVALSGFQSLMLLDKKGCRPFDSDRSGLQIGEAYGAIILEAKNSNPENESKAFTILGGENLCDTHHVTSASPDGIMMQHVIDQALANAGLKPADINFIKAHGTGSPDNDTAEAAALNSVFGQSMPPITVLKRYFGHTLGACGVVETIGLFACLQAGFLPATAGFKNSDPALNLIPLTKPIQNMSGYFLSNYFGFGGNYAALLMHYEPAIA
ncbi:MAG: beta-ketoacyl synthase N-terminal-like domain-containing protein [Acidiferrobacterales bacterium]